MSYDLLRLLSLDVLGKYTGGGVNCQCLGVYKGRLIDILLNNCYNRVVTVLLALPLLLFLQLRQ